MSTRMKVITARKYVTRGETRTHWMEIGVAFVNDQGCDIQLHVLPLPDENGQVRMLIRPIGDQQQQQRPYAPPQQQRPQQGGYGPPPQRQTEYAPSHSQGAHTQSEPGGYVPNASDDDQLPF